MQNTTLCYIECNGKYLLLHRTKKAHDINEGKWVGIGGHFEEGESALSCAIREIKEETSLDVSPADMCYCAVVTFLQCNTHAPLHKADALPMEATSSAPTEGEYMHLFHVILPHDVYSAPPPVPCCEEGDLEWVEIDKMDTLPQWEGDKIFLRLMQENRPFFRLRLVYNGGKLCSSTLL